MELVVAKTSGFCHGVKRAVETVYANVDHKPVYTYGPIIHNSQVVEDLEDKGVKVLNSLDDLPINKKGTIIIRSHGVGEAEILQMEASGYHVINATCPYVRSIHKIVAKCSGEGYNVIIIGNRKHPEVEGIRGWSRNKVYIIEEIEDIEKVGLNKDEAYCVVAQTTYNLEKFKKIIEKLHLEGFRVIINETICNATEMRQKEAAEIAGCVTKMIVIGGKHSSNTQKLYQICKEKCENTYHIETLSDLKLNVFTDSDIIGITAGASTPKNIIEEVIRKMAEEQSFEQMLEESFVSIRRGEIIEGSVIEVRDNEIIVNVGYKSDGIIPKDEYSNSDVNLREEVKEGDTIKVKVLKVNDGEGQVKLTHKRIKTEEGMKKIEELYNSGEEITATVSSVLSGGLVVIVEEVRVFIPASLISDSYVSDLSEYKNKEITFVITELNTRKNRIIGNRKILLEKEKRALQEKALETIQVGDVIDGVVKNITDYGVFVNINGIDGLVHVSELSWGRVKSPKDYVKISDEVTVKVLSVNKEKRKVSLTMKLPENNPWNNAEEKYAEGNIVNGRVARMTDFGAFVELEEGVDALLHVSQISIKHVEKPKDVLKVGDQIEAKITELKLEEKKISLSVKALEMEKEAAEKTEEVAEEGSSEE